MAKHDSPTPPKKRQAPQNIDLTDREMVLLKSVPFWLKTNGGLRPSESSSTTPQLSEFVAQWLIRAGVLVWSEKSGVYQADLTQIDIASISEISEVTP